MSRKSQADTLVAVPMGNSSTPTLGIFQRTTRTADGRDPGAIGAQRFEVRKIALYMLPILHQRQVVFETASWRSSTASIEPLMSMSIWRRTVPSHYRRAYITSASGRRN